jgi:hypothetical protein
MHQDPQLFAGVQQREFFPGLRFIDPEVGQTPPPPWGLGYATLPKLQRGRAVGPPIFEKQLSGAGSGVAVSANAPSNV